NFATVQEQGYIPLYKRTAITDELHHIFGFSTDFQFITKREMRNIQKKVREDKKYYISLRSKKVYQAA
uniref:hypothetical protein n=1 Tax=Anaerovibrio slackiae TaxID=2652309 RepID=UPI0038678A46